MPEQPMSIPAQVWVNDLWELSDSEALVEMEDGLVVVERTDEDEVAIHFTPEGEDNALSSVYMTRERAHVIAALLQWESSRAQ